MRSVWAGVITALTLLLTAGFAVSAKEDKHDVNTTSPHPAMEKALFAGGCFWCMEKPFEELDGVHFGDIRLCRRYHGKPDL